MQTSSIIIIQNFQLQSTTKYEKKMKKVNHPIQLIKRKNHSREETPDSHASTTTTSSC